MDAGKREERTLTQAQEEAYVREAKGIRDAVDADSDWLQPPGGKGEG